VGRPVGGTGTRPPPIRAVGPYKTDRLVWSAIGMAEQGVRSRQPRAEATRAHLIETAALAFAEHGFEAVSLNDLVEASGLSKGAFYFHFASKEDLALAAFRAKQEELVSRLLAGELPEAAAERVRVLLRRRARLIGEDPSLGCVTRLGSELNVRSAPGSDYTGFQKLALGLIADLVREGQARREFRADLDPEAAARVVFAAIVGMDVLSLLFSEGKDLERRSDEFVELILVGLLVGTGPTRTRPRGKERGHGTRHTTPKPR